MNQMSNDSYRRDKRSQGGKDRKSNKKVERQMMVINRKDKLEETNLNQAKKIQHTSRNNKHNQLERYL